MEEEEQEPAVAGSLMEAQRLERDKRIEILGKRLMLLEKDLDSRPETPLEEALLLCWDVYRSIPVCSILAFLTSCVGLRGMMELGHQMRSATMHLDGHLDVQELTSNVGLLCSMIFFLNVATLIVAFPATGATRDFVFGHEHSDGLMACLTCMIGPCVLWVLLVFQAASVTILFLGIAATLPATSLFALVAGSCEAGSNGDLAAAVADMLGAELRTTKASIEGICSVDYLDVTNGSAAFCVMLGVACVGQVMLLVTHMSNYEKVAMEKDCDAELKSTKAFLESAAGVSSTS